MPAVALIDTGSMLTLASSSVVKWWKVDPTQIPDVFTLAGQLPLVGMAMVEIGFGPVPKKTYKHTVYVLETRYLGNACIIGTDFLTRFPSVTLDYQGRKLKLGHCAAPMGIAPERPESLGSSRLNPLSSDWEIMSKVIPSGASMFPLMIEDVCVLALLDTGANLTVIPDRLAPALRIHQLQPPCTRCVTTLAGTVPLLDSARVTMHFG